MTPFNYALMLMIVGMGTVFVALLLMIFSSKALIHLVNRWVPEEKIPEKVKQVAAISSKKIAVITAAVSIASKGKARIVNIEKK